MKKFKESFSNSSSVSIVIIAAVASYLDAALIVSVGIALPLWTQKFSLDTWKSGAISTVLTLLIAVGSFTGGWLADKFGRTFVFNTDILLTAIGTFIIAIAPNFYALLFGLVLAGLCSGADLPTSLAVISERVSTEDYGKAITITQGFWISGIILSQLIGFLTADLKYFSTTIMFMILTLVALVNWSNRVFSKKVHNLEKNLLANNYENENNENIVSIFQQLKNNPRIFVGGIVITLFYLFWNLPANTWGSFLNYYLVIIDDQPQSIATSVGFFANLIGFCVNLFYMTKSDTKLRYKFMKMGIFFALFSFIMAGLFNKYWYVFSMVYVIYSISTVFCGESLYKIWSQMFYPSEIRSTLTGFSYGLVRMITAGFALITPTIMAYSSELLMLILAGCVLAYGICALIILKMIKHFKLKDPSL